MLQHIGRFVPAMTTDIVRDSVLKFHQLSTPLVTVTIDTEKELLILKRNPENFSRISLASYDVSHLPNSLSGIERLVNNFTNCDCSYFVVYSFYTDRFVKSGNCAYDITGERLVKYSEVLDKNDWDFSVSFFVSFKNVRLCYGEFGFVKATVSIGQAIERLNNFVKEKPLSLMLNTKMQTQHQTNYK